MRKYKPELEGGREDRCAHGQRWVLPSAGRTCETRGRESLRLVCTCRESSSSWSALSLRAVVGMYSDAVSTIVTYSDRLKQITNIQQ
ncbi:hypothetical protein MDA_GLEAN10002938 [Myotis davidii]|uniref:Uncharacterized protein n=1 Tax=Myotis davidii TaxID=225400 RepID=L5M6A5_MYODS|nr:hypothetical protein MDA_GLEAN10002938 [Myotis davidii]